MVFKIHYEGKILGNHQQSKGVSKKTNAEEYENFKTYIGWLCKQQNKNEPMIEGKVEIMILYNSGLDIDNLQKGILDALQGIAYTKDRKIKKERVEECKQIEKGFFMVINSLPDNTSIDAEAITTNICA